MGLNRSLELLRCVLPGNLASYEPMAIVRVFQLGFFST
jgi:hypothetical protein